MAAAEDMRGRLETSVALLSKLTDSSGRDIRHEEIACADCVAIIPAFKKVALAVGVSFGREFISCRNGENWSATSGNKALYGKTITNNQIIETAAASAVASTFVSKLTSLLRSESATASNSQPTQ